MADDFNWIRDGFELIKAKFEWNVQVPFLENVKDVELTELESPFFSSTDTWNFWKLWLHNESPIISICVVHYNSEREKTPIFEPALVNISIINEKGRKVFHKLLLSESDLSCYVEFTLPIEKVIKSECQQVDGSYTFFCEVFYHVEISPGLPGCLSHDPQALTIDCSDGLIDLSTQLEELFDSMQFSDVIFKISSRQFPAHKSILAARSKVFEAMFLHSTKEKLTNEIEIEDIQPDVFHQLLHFIYTGRVNSTTMETLAAGLLIAADKYLIIELKSKCQNYLACHMSPVNCVELLLHCDLLNPAEHLQEVVNEAVKFFRRLQSQVMATEKWEKMEEENPKLLFKIQKFLFRNK